ncbi:MAG: hypothetical protein GXP25_04170 [Planctomycetes bacterium]|nr:hypothetical protein [Planctomycetota bacterium]
MTDPNRPTPWPRTWPPFWRDVLHVAIAAGAGNVFAFVFGPLVSGLVLRHHSFEPGTGVFIAYSFALLARMGILLLPAFVIIVLSPTDPQAQKALLLSFLSALVLADVIPLMMGFGPSPMITIIPVRALSELGATIGGFGLAGWLYLKLPRKAFWQCLALPLALGIVLLFARWGQNLARRRGTGAEKMDHDGKGVRGYSFFISRRSWANRPCRACDSRV